MGKSKVANGTKLKAATKADLAEAKPKKSVKIAPPKVDSEDDSASEESDSEDSDESESEVDSDSASDGSEDGSDGSSDDSESDKEDKPKSKGKAAPNGKVNGKAKAAAADEDDDSDDSDSSESSDDEETAKPKSTAATNGTDKKPAAAADDESGSDDSDDSASESGSDSGSDDDEDAEEDTAMTDAKAPAAVPEKKRKAEDADEKPFKKARADDSEKEATTNLFVGNLSWNVDDNTLYEEFKHCGEILAARVITDRESGRSRGFGYVDFANEADATKAYTEKQGWFIDGRQIKIDYASGGNKNDSRPRNQNGAASRAQKYGDTPSAPSETLFIGNLSFQATEDSVSEFFNSVAPVQSLRLITDKDTGNMKGFGYVTFGSVEDAKNALESLNGEDCAGRNVRLDYSTPKPQQSGGFGGGRGGRGGFGGRGGRGGFGDRGGRGGFGGRGGGARGGRSGGYAGKKISFD